MVSNGGLAKIDLLSNRLFQPRKAPLVLSLRPSAELLVFKMGPVAGPCRPERVRYAKHGPYSMEGPLVPEVGSLITVVRSLSSVMGPLITVVGLLTIVVGPLSSEGPRAPRVPAV